MDIFRNIFFFKSMVQIFKSDPDFRCEEILFSIKRFVPSDFDICHSQIILHFFFVNSINSSKLLFSLSFSFGFPFFNSSCLSFSLSESGFSSSSLSLFFFFRVQKKLRENKELKEKQ